MLSSKLITVQELAESPENPFTAGQIRWWIFRETLNGFDSVVVRVGKRVYIDHDAFERWLEEHRGRRQ